MLRTALIGAVPCLMIDDHRDESDDDSIPPNRPNLVPLLWHAQKASLDSASLARFLTLCEESGNQPVLSIDPKGLDEGVSAILANAPSPLILTLSTEIETNLISGYRELAVYVSNLGLHSPIWIRNHGKDHAFSQRMTCTQPASLTPLCFLDHCFAMALVMLSQSNTLVN